MSHKVLGSPLPLITIANAALSGAIKKYVIAGSLSSISMRTSIVAMRSRRVLCIVVFVIRTILLGLKLEVS